jgi:hypothetical protein
MATILNASTSSGLVATADNTGIIQLQTNGTNTVNVATTGLTTIAYNGANAGLVPGMQYYRLNADLVGGNVTTAQNTFGVSVTLSSNTVYAFETNIALSKTAGATSHTIAVGFGGAATLNNILYSVVNNIIGGGGNLSINTSQNIGYINAATSTVITSAVANATITSTTIIRGTVSVNAGGTFTPQYTLSAAPGGAYSTVAGSYFAIYPLAASGSNVSIGTWA